MNTSNSIPADVARDLHNALMCCDPTDFVAQLTELVGNYTFVLNSIANGYGNAERPANEDPVQELADLREAFAPDINRIDSISQFVNSFATLMCAVNRVDWVYRKTVNR